MAANTETVSIDTVEKSLWDSLVALGENISGETLTALMEIIEGGGSSNAPYELTGTIDDVTHAITLSDITAAELYAVVASGKTVKLTIPIGGGNAINVLGVSAQIAEPDYDFAVLVATGQIFATGHIGAADSVVLTPVRE